MIEHRLDRLQALMERLLPAMLRLARPTCDEVLLTPQQFHFLLVLAERGPLSISALRQVLEGAQSSISEMVGRLARLGYVVKRRDPEDRRSVKVAITASARAVLKARQKEFRTRSERILLALSSDEQERWIEAFDTMVSLVERAASREGDDLKKEADR